MYLKAWRKATLKFFILNVYILLKFFFLLVDRVLTAILKRRKNMIKANIYEKELFIEGCAVSDSVKFDTVKFSFPESWQIYEKTVVFSNDAGTQLNVLLNPQNSLCVGENECYIPHEVLKSPGFSISVFGIKDDRVATTTKKFVKVIESGYALGDEPSEPTISQYQQIINLSTEALNIAQSVRQDADNGVFNGEKGEAGEPGEASPEFIAMVKETQENARKTEVARLALENGTEWVFDGGNAETNSAEIKFILDNQMSDESENAVENKVIKEYIDNLIKQAKLDAHPIGSYYWSSASTAPSELFGGKWEQVQGKFILAAGTYTDKNGITRSFAVGGTDEGEYNHTLNVSEMPTHKHDKVYIKLDKEYEITYSNRDYAGAGTSAAIDTNKSTSIYTSTSGGNQPHNNIPPYEVAYCWKRIA